MKQKFRIGIYTLDENSEMLGTANLYILMAKEKEKNT